MAVKLTLYQSYDFITRGTEPLYRRAQEIFEKSLGPNHPHVATVIGDRASLLEAQLRAVGKLREIPCGTRVVSGVLNIRAASLKAQARAARIFEEISCCAL